MADRGAMLVTIRPGPVLHVWRNGVEVARVPMTIPQSLTLLAGLAQAVRGHQ